MMNWRERFQAGEYRLEIHDDLADLTKTVILRVKVDVKDLRDRGMTAQLMKNLSVESLSLMILAAYLERNGYEMREKETT